MSDTNGNAEVEPAQRNAEAVAALRNSTAEWLSPFTGVRWTVRRIGRADIPFSPKAWPIFDRMLGALYRHGEENADDEAAREVWRRKREALDASWEELVKDELEIDRVLMVAAVTSPVRVYDDTEALTRSPVPDPPDGGVWFHQVVELDKANLVRITVQLASGVPGAELEGVAAKAAQFREERPGGNGETDSEPERAASIGSPGD